MRKSIYTLIYILIAVVLFASCEHKELCYKHPHTAKVRIDVDWSKFDKYETPTGMTLMLYPQYSGENIVTHLTNNISHAMVNLAADSYQVLVFNQSSSEFGSILFRGLEKQETAEVVTNEVKSRWYTVRSKLEKVVANPEWLGVANYNNAEVTQAMIDAEAKNVLSNGLKIDEPLIASLKPQNIVYTVKIKVHIKSIYNLRSVRASLNGMAEGYRLISMQPLENKVTHLIEEWTLKPDETDPSAGIIETTFSCFGFPEGYQTTAEENLFALSLLLVDNKTIMNYSFHVGDKFTKNGNIDNLEGKNEFQLELHLDIDSSITLPDVKPEGGTSGGFDAEVEDWGDEEEIEIEI